jgi:hypothetical protein
VSSDATPVTCSTCGASAPSPPLDWMRQSDPWRGATWVCADCARRHVRSIEARLDQQWW